MPDIVVRTEIPSESGLAIDKFTNTFSFTSVPDLDSATLEALCFAVEAFYAQIPDDGLIALADLYSPEVDSASPTWVTKAYDATGKLSGIPNLGAPIHTKMSTFSDPPVGAVGLPAEVAFCVTLEGLGRAEAPVEEPDGADPGGEVDRPMQRRTGRVYLGPFNTDVLSVVFAQVRPDAALMDTARLAVKQLQSDAFLNAGGSELAVWSRADATMYPVVSVSTDNAFDTMRSRGCDSTLRERTNV